LRSSTIMRRDHAKTPPKPDSEIVAKAMNSSPRLGCAGCGDGDAEAGRGLFCAGGSLSGIGGALMKIV
jgi:hypothetical protein